MSTGAEETKKVMENEDPARAAEMQNASQGAENIGTKLGDMLDLGEGNENLMSGLGDFLNTLMSMMAGGAMLGQLTGQGSVGFIESFQQSMGSAIGQDMSGTTLSADGSVPAVAGATPDPGAPSADPSLIAGAPNMTPGGGRPA